MKLGYTSKAKGIVQVLWERGLWVNKMKLKLPAQQKDYPDLSTSYVLANCTNFKEEVGAMEKLVIDCDHIVKFSPKGHPYVAGCGIEFDWGVSKKIFRKENNHVPKYCERDVMSSLGKVNIDIAYNTSRKARTYMKAYTNNCGGSQLLIEKFVKIHKCHRNILDQDTKYLDELKIKIEKYAEEIKTEKVSLQNEKEEDKIKVEKILLTNIL